MVSTLTLDELAHLAACASGAAYRDRLMLHAADGVLALMAGARTAEGRALQAFLGRNDSSALGAVARNAATMRLTEIDDIHRPTAVTATAIVLPAALGMVAHGAGPLAADHFLDAVFVGQEIAVRIAQALGGAGLLGAGIWPSYVVAPVGAAAATGRLLGLNPERMAHALALALAQTPRVIGKSSGSRPGRWLLFGNAVRAGCLSALAAADGFDGDVSILNPTWLRATGVPELAPEVVAGNSAVIEQLSIKPHCSAKQVLAAIHGMRSLIAGGLDPEKIEFIELGVPAAYSSMIDREPACASRLASMVSARWQLALAALAPTALDDVAREVPPGSQAVQALSQSIRIYADPALDSYYPSSWPARLCVQAGGRRQEILVENSPGDPALPYDELQMLDKARRVLGDSADLQWVNQALRLHEDPLGLRKLLSRFAPLPPV